MSKEARQTYHLALVQGLKSRPDDKEVPVIVRREPLSATSRGAADKLLQSTSPSELLGLFGMTKEDLTEEVSIHFIVVTMPAKGTNSLSLTRTQKVVDTIVPEKEVLMTFSATSGDGESDPVGGPLSSDPVGQDSSSPGNLPQGSVAPATETEQDSADASPEVPSSTSSKEDSKEEEEREPVPTDIPGV